MSGEDAINKLDALIAALEGGMKKISEEVATNAMALIINRIQQEGLEGEKYSKNKLPNFFFENKGNIAAQKAIKSKKKNSKYADGVSYEEWRDLNGLQTDIVDLTFTGRMFQNIGITSAIQVGNNFITVITGFDKEVKDKLRWNAARYGDFFKVNEKEKEELKLLFESRVAALLKSVGL